MTVADGGHHDFGDLQARYAGLLAKLAPRKPRGMFQDRVQTRRSDAGYPHVEWVHGHYHHVVTERGRELARRIATNEDELLYWLMADVTTGIAHEEVPGFRFWRRRDPRRRRFSAHVALLARLDPRWAARKQAEYAHVLRNYPFRDGG